MTAPRDERASGAPGASSAGPTAPNERDAQLERLMQRVARADRQAFQSLYELTSPTLFAVVLRINRDRSAAEELLQEVFMAVWRQAERYDSTQSRVMTWLTTIARHRAIDSLRRKSSEPVTISRFSSLGGGAGGSGGAGDDDDVDVLATLRSDEPGPLELLDDATRANDLERCMQHLTGEQRSCLALAYYQGLSHAEVAQHMSQPLGTVKSWVRRGLQSLRSCLDRAVRQVRAEGRVA
ncbi:sigma-70 family RNA polymerase sigma factor [Roseateles depolymerans]|uniref:RNA polymerase sigma factor n=1 Tax=Roseateles depolymerans TaxID=76731 RepID=A0A0U3LGH6_9BURK|nr:sigma-70 family RNA polymerase sigma factor [Roseateles depolymerans]ALV07183.1 RNA polymerase sigma-e factor sigma-24 [Roseateles depolymerans]REG20166.1 RNA polymerase sigma-70 factor (ECF subfamily) [Roseateles depolymerans]